MLVGFLNDTVFAGYGTQSVRFSLVIAAVSGVLSSICYFAAAPRMAADIARASTAPARW